MIPAKVHWTKGTGRAALTVLLLALVWATLFGRSDAQPPVTVRVLGPTAVVPAGQSFTVTIAVENAQNLGAFEFKYHFTPAVVSATAYDIQLSSLLGSTGRTTGDLRLASAPGQPGVPLFGAYSYGAPSGPTGNGVLATVTMTAVAPGTSQLSLSGLKVTDVAGAEVTALTTAGSVTVGEALQRSIYMPLLRRNSGN
jgi:hypothetical protein